MNFFSALEQDRTGTLQSPCETTTIASISLTQTKQTKKLSSQACSQFRATAWRLRASFCQSLETADRTDDGRMVRTVAAGGHAVEVSGVRPEVGVRSVAYLQAADRDVLHRRLLAAGDLCSRCNLGLRRKAQRERLHLH